MRSVSAVVMLYISFMYIINRVVSSNLLGYSVVYWELLIIKLMIMDRDVWKKFRSALATPFRT